VWISSSHSPQSRVATLDLIFKGYSLVKFYVSKTTKSNFMLERWKRKHSAKKWRRKRTFCKKNKEWETLHNFHDINQNFEVPEPLTPRIAPILFPHRWCHHFKNVLWSNHKLQTYQYLFMGHFFPNYFSFHINVILLHLIHTNTNNKFAFRHSFFKIFSNIIIEISF
jgi:hypothetical protein